MTTPPNSLILACEIIYELLSKGKLDIFFRLAKVKKRFICDAQKDKP
jgi:hypothetical protein